MTPLSILCTGCDTRKRLNNLMKLNSGSLIYIVIHSHLYLVFSVSTTGVDEK